MNDATRLEKILELKARRAWAKAMPPTCEPRCAIIAHGRNFGMREAMPGNKHMKPGTIHRQCEDCKIRDKNEVMIAFLKHDVFDA